MFKILTKNIKIPKGMRKHQEEGKNSNQLALLATRIEGVGVLFINNMFAIIFNVNIFIY